MPESVRKCEICDGTRYITVACLIKRDGTVTPTAIAPCPRCNTKSGDVEMSGDKCEVFETHPNTIIKSISDFYALLEPLTA